VEIKQMSDKILVRTPNWLGDALMSIPTIKAINKLYPKSAIWVLTKENLSGLWELVPEVKGVLSLKDSISMIKKEKFNLAVLLTNSFGSALNIFKTRIPKRIGYANNLRSFMLTDRIKLETDWKKMHQIEYYLNIITKNSDINTIPKIDIKEDSIKNARSFLQERGCSDSDFVIGIHATASYGPAKCWIPERFSRLINELIDLYNAKILICGSRNEKKDIENIIKNVYKKNKVINTAGETNLGQLAALLSQCKAFIANDSGPMHLAASVGTPVIAIFGSTDPDHTGPRGNVAIVKKDIICSPCFKRECVKQMDCMRLIEVNDVIASVKRLI